MSGPAGAVFLQACGAARAADWQGWEGTLRGLDGGQWRAVEAYASEHGFVGLVARSLTWAEELAGVKAPIGPSLEAARRGQLLQHLGRRAAARRVADAWAAKDIPFIAFKGIVLAEEVYGDLSLRGFRDLDAMVPDERLDEAFAIARELGYRLTLLAGVRDYQRAGAHAAGLAHPDGWSLDLHWRIAPDLDPARAATAWRDCVPAPEGANLPGQRLSPEMTLLHLAKHFHSHQYGELKPLVDFHVASSRYARAITPDRLAKRARELDIEPVLEIATAVCRQTFGGAGAPARSLRVRVAQRALSRDFLLDSARRSRLGNWARFLVASGSAAASVRSIAAIVVPGRLVLTQFFNRPFQPRMYLQYYWRQLVKVLTLSTR